MIERRAFAGAAFSGLGITGLFARAVHPRVDIPMRVFGKTGERLTILGQGGAKLAYLRNTEDARAHVLYALDLGVNYFDCARRYWNGLAEEVYGDVLSPFRKRLFLTTKTAKRTAAEARQELDASLLALKTNYVDLWQMHDIRTQDDIARIFGPGGAIEAFEGARQAGKCRFVGFTAHYDPEITVRMLRAYDRFDSILMPLHAADPSYLSFEQTALPEAVSRGVAIQAMKVFGSAVLLRSLHVRECLQYTLSLPVHTAVVGCSSSGHWDDDLRVVGLRRTLAPEEMEAIRKRAVGPGRANITGPVMEYWKRDTRQAK